MDIKPQHARLLIELVEEVSGSKLVLPDNVKDGTLSKWIVRERGPGSLLPDGTYAPLPVEAGDEVLINTSLGTTVKLTPEYMFNERKLMIVDFSCVLAVIKRTPEELEAIKNKLANPQIVAAKPLVN